MVEKHGKTLESCVEEFLNEYKNWMFIVMFDECYDVPEWRLNLNFVEFFVETFRKLTVGECDFRFKELFDEIWRSRELCERWKTCEKQIFMKLSLFGLL